MPVEAVGPQMPPRPGGPLALVGDSQEAADRINQNLQRGEVALPMLPETAGQVIALASSDDGDASQLARLIQQDPSLVVEVLRVANTAAFRGAAEMVSVQQAIARMGMDRVGDVALAASLRAELFRADQYIGRLGLFWREAVAASAWAREVAKACRRNVEMAYLSGLLHDIGVPVVLSQLQSLRGAPLPPEQLESVLWAVAPLAGLKLIEAWQLPVEIGDVVSQWHVDGGDNTNCQIVQAAMTLAAIGAEGIDPDCLAAEAGARSWPSAFAQLNLYPEDIEQLLTRCGAMEAMIEAMSL